MQRASARIARDIREELALPLQTVHSSIPFDDR
jgi:hypothetical protein